MFPRAIKFVDCLRLVYLSLWGKENVLHLYSREIIHVYLCVGGVKKKRRCGHERKVCKAVQFILSIGESQKEGGVQVNGALETRGGREGRVEVESDERKQKKPL